MRRLRAWLRELLDCLADAREVECSNTHTGDTLCPECEAASDVTAYGSWMDRS